MANAQDPNRSYGGSGSIPGPHLQLPTQVKVPDTAPSIRFAMEGDIDGLKYLFSQRLASPRAVSNSRGFSLVRVGLTTPSTPNLIFCVCWENAENIVSGHSTVECATIELSSFYLIVGRSWMTSKFQVGIK